MGALKRLLLGQKEEPLFIDSLFTPKPVDFNQPAFKFTNQAVEKVKSYIPQPVKQAGKEFASGFLNPAERVEDAGFARAAGQYFGASPGGEIIGGAGAIGSLASKGRKIGKEVIEEAPKVFTGFKDLTTKVLERLKGKAVTSKQEILDLTNMADLKQTERDLIRRVVGEYGDAEPLIQEARKYKSADEFVKSQGTPLYHRTDASFDNFDLAKKQDVSSGIHFHDDKIRSDYQPNIDRFGKNQIEAYSDAKIADITGKGDDGLSYGHLPKDIQEVAKLSPKERNLKLKELGYGGFKLGNEVVIFDSKNIKTKSQLTDLWNKAKNDKIPVQEFANKVKTELLPLKGKTNEGQYAMDPDFEGLRAGYENVTLPDELRGPIANYFERTYESP